MRWKTYQDIRWIEFDSFAEKDIKHGIYTRHGGVSEKPWDSLNLGGTVGDSRENVITNKRKLLDTQQIVFTSVYDAWQVHSADYIRVENPRDLNVSHMKADILITNVPGITLMMRFADCVPIMVYDKEKGAIGIAHAGWMGTTKNVAAALVNAMHNEFGSSRESIIAGIGPSIGQDHYPVGDEVVKAIRAVMDKESDLVLDRKNGQPYLDLWKTNQILLQRAGIKHIEIAEICTACNNNDWFSHRADKGNTGRFGAIIQIPSLPEGE